MNLAGRIDQRLLAGESRNPLRDAARSKRLRAMAKVLKTNAEADAAAEAASTSRGDWQTTHRTDRAASDAALFARRDLAKTTAELSGKSGNLSVEEQAFAHHASTSAKAVRDETETSLVAENFLDAVHQYKHNRSYRRGGGQGTRTRGLDAYDTSFDAVGSFSSRIQEYGDDDIIVDAGGGEGHWVAGLAARYAQHGGQMPRIFSVDRIGSNWVIADKVGRLGERVKARVSRGFNTVYRVGGDGKLRHLDLADFLAQKMPGFRVVQGPRAVDHTDNPELSRGQVLTLERTGASMSRAPSLRKVRSVGTNGAPRRAYLVE